jgi:hypothetical protein
LADVEQAWDGAAHRAQRIVLIPQPWPRPADAAGERSRSTHAQ